MELALIKKLYGVEAYENEKELRASEAAARKARLKTNLAKLKRTTNKLKKEGKQEAKMVGRDKLEVKLFQLTRDRRNYGLAKELLATNLKNSKDGFEHIYREMHNEYADKLGIPPFDALKGLAERTARQKLKLIVKE